MGKEENFGFWILDFGIPSWEACAELVEVGRGGSVRILDFEFPVSASPPGRPVLSLSK